MHDPATDATSAADAPLTSTENTTAHPVQTPPAPWQDVPLEKWQDWRWQLSHRLNNLDELKALINLTPEEATAIDTQGLFRLDITPYFASLIDPDDPHCPIRKQVIPTSHEMVPFQGERVDSLSEADHSPVNGLVHRYPDRVLMLVTTQCASYCRFCTRSRIVGDASAMFSQADYSKQLEYIAANPQIRDVLLSGGDPLSLPAKVLEKLLAGLRAIDSVEIIRIGTRIPLFLPQRLTDDYVQMLAQFHPLWMNIHFNHPDEITPEVSAGLNKLANAGVPLGSQTVLMAGINDCPNIMKALMKKLVYNRVRPYYIYQCDLVHGSGHFRTSVAKGMEIMEHLRGHMSGYAVPTYVIDAPEGGGKVPMSPNYLLSMSDNKVIVRNYEGFISTYDQPEDYSPHDPSTCEYCQNAKAHPDEPGQEGVGGLLSGAKQVIRPEGWADVHKRGRE